MNDRDALHKTNALGAPSQATEVAPEACPFCHSGDVKTTSTAVNVSTYWRCIACGEIWNVGRLPGRRTPYGRFR